MTAPDNPEMHVVLAGADGKILDRFLPESLMSQAEMAALMEQVARPPTGWPKASLSSGVQASLDRADTALQSAPVSSVAGRTGSVVITVADVSDASNVGRNVLTAASPASARSAIGAGTSNLVLGTTAGTASEATHTHAYASLTGIPSTFTPAAHQHEIGHINNLVATLDNLDSRLSSHTHPAAQIADSTTVGRSVLMASNAAAARSAIGAGTSSLSLGTTASSAKPGDWQPTVDNINGSTVVGRSVLRAADPAAVREVIGAGTGSSNLELGTTATTAKSGDWLPSWGDVTGKPSVFLPSSHTHVITDVTNLQSALDGKASSTHSHTAAQISDATAVGRNVLTATDAAAARSAIGAGTSSLAIGTAAGTAAAGNDSRLSNQRTPTDNSVSNIKLIDGAVTDAKVSVNAAIALSKLATGNALGRSNATPADVTVVTCTEAQYAGYDAGDKANPNFVFVVRP